jgi:cyanophycin synthetase
VASGDLTGPWSANVVLSDPSVEIAVLETARGGIMRGGLGYDWSDVGVITNIQRDHLGQDGIIDIDDVAKVKRLIAERVREGGTLVLNADDDVVMKLRMHPKVADVPKRLVYFSLSANNGAIRSHLAQGGTAFVLHNGWLEERNGEEMFRIATPEMVPCTLSGTATFQVANVLAACAAARAAGASRETVVAAIQSFEPCRHGNGRLNVFGVNRGYAVVDYAHNPAAIAALCRTAAKWDVSRLTVVLGLPGDRRDDLIREAARSVIGVDRVIIREDADTRGRPRGAIASMIARVLREEAPTVPVETVLDELDAASAAVTSLQDGEAALLLCENVDGVIARLHEHGATALDAYAFPARRVRASQSAA